MHPFLCSSGEWNVTLKCPRGHWRIREVTPDNPLTVFVKWRDGSKDFKFCTLPSYSYHQPWTVMAKQGSENNNVAINQEMKYYTYEDSKKLGIWQF